MRFRPALLLIDFVNTLDFDGGARLSRRAVAAARQTRRLKERAHAEGVPTIYVNDHFGDWSANFDAVLQRCERSRLGRGLVALLCPQPGDLSILKPRHSAFYGTPLEFLLAELRIDGLILTGLQAHICVLFSAHDAYLRRYRLWVPVGCVASETAADERAALRHMAEVTGAEIRPYSSLPNKSRLADAFGKQDKRTQRFGNG
ncbi:MAG: isochorismatase family protein [Betaproteobacteria bacterium]|nr:isochorismatase family protein [Betaproteobacteria bacterium]